MISGSRRYRPLLCTVIRMRHEVKSVSRASGWRRRRPGSVPYTTFRASGHRWGVPHLEVFIPLAGAVGLVHDLAPDGHVAQRELDADLHILLGAKTEDFLGVGHA
jgi:hypothetical protein